MRKYIVLAAAAFAALASCTKVLEVEAPSGNGSTMVLRAGFEDETTRTSLEPDGGGSVSVLWNSGDAIRVLASQGSGYYYADFTTSDDGVSQAEFYCHNWNPIENSHYAAVYPSDMFKGFRYDSSDGYRFGMVVPPAQTAVKGGVERGLIRSFSAIGSKEDLAGDISFKNALAMLRFRLTGASASRVKKVKLVANSVVAGDGMVFISDSGEMTHTTTSYYLPLEYGQMSNIELSGDFTAGAEYYIAAWPGVSNGFSLLFFDASDRVLARYSDKTLSLNRSRITDLGTIALNEEFGTPDPNVVKYMSHTKGSKPVTIAIVGDGFTASEKDKFLSLAGSAADFLFGTEPYKSYKDYFNVYLMWAASNESGASVTDGNGTVTSRKDTYFGAKWGQNSYGDMNSDYDKVWGFVSARCPEIQSGELSIDEVPVAMIINDKRYGGLCFYTSSGRCVAHVPYTDDGGGLAWSFPAQVASDDAVVGTVRNVTEAERNELGRSQGDWRNTFIHEFGGHGFGRLLDEYWSGTSYNTGTTISLHSWPIPAGLNISGTYDNVPWQADLLDNLPSLVARDPHYARIGRFQGGDVMICNRWRSEKISCMIDNRQYFSTWQRILIVKRILQLAGESFSLSDFWSKDVTIDPVRDASSSGAPAPAGYEGSHRTYTECPPLPPPVLLY